MAQVGIKPENKQKIKDWVAKLKVLEEVDLPMAKQRVGKSLEAGDWHENAEFEDAERQVEVISGRIDEIKRIIRALKREK